MRKIKRRERKRRKGCDFVEVSESDDDVLNVAMQSGIRNHPPIAHKRSISINQLHPKAKKR
ncbi:hypothetical protein CsSME_00041560 [Camellia sinensis var. sinensis]